MRVFIVKGDLKSVFDIRFVDSAVESFNNFSSQFKVYHPAISGNKVQIGADFIREIIYFSVLIYFVVTEFAA